MSASLIVPSTLCLRHLTDSGCDASNVVMWVQFLPEVLSDSELNRPEQRTPNAQVAGAIPAESTIIAGSSN
jgi:hypothetical protein